MSKRKRKMTRQQRRKINQALAYKHLRTIEPWVWTRPEALERELKNGTPIHVQLIRKKLIRFKP